jgi:dihydroorotase-like cyclic amidohydrolase
MIQFTKLIRRFELSQMSTHLREALADGTIDIVATDHAPHPLEDKECEWQEAAFGMLGLETALSIVQKDDGRHWFDELGSEWLIA